VPVRCLDKAGKKRSGQRERPRVSPLYLGSKGELPKEAGLTTAIALVPRAARRSLGGKGKLMEPSTCEMDSMGCRRG